MRTVLVFCSFYFDRNYDSEINRTTYLTCETRAESINRRRFELRALTSFDRFVASLNEMELTANPMATATRSNSIFREEKPRDRIKESRENVTRSISSLTSSPFANELRIFCLARSVLCVSALIGRRDRD